MTTPELVARRPFTTEKVADLSQSGVLWCALLTPAVFLIHGYHPFADDAAVYVPGIRKLISPGLFRSDADFVLAHTHISIFAHLMAWTVRLTHLPLPPLLLSVQAASIFLFLLACHTLAERFFTGLAQRWSTVILAAACFTLPVAGTSLSLMDPCVTARSVSTPLGLFALAAAIDRRWPRCFLLLLAAALLHPLMAGYAAGFIAVFFLIDFGIPRAAFVVCAQALAATAILSLITRHFPASAAYRQAVLSRDYLVPSQWTKVDDLGIGVPLILFAIAAGRRRLNPLVRKLSLAACLYGITAALIGFLFVHTDGPLFLVRVQPLRSFHIIYAVGVLLLGGYLGSIFFASGRSLRSHWMAVSLLAVVAAILFWTQRTNYPLSAHMELPGTPVRNPWEQAFLWIRVNTPPEAIFAANPHLVFVPGEDAQGFRAIAERSLLADDKDEGIVVAFPHLAEEWARQRNAQAGIDQMTDEQRIAATQPFGADWVLLPATAATALPCPYRNIMAQVCRLQ